MTGPLRLEYLRAPAGRSIGDRVEVKDLGWGTIAGSTYRFSLVTLDGDDGFTPCDPGALLPRPVKVARAPSGPVTVRQNTPAQDAAMRVALATVDRLHAELAREREARRMVTVGRAA